jgi:hypothetical protein
MEIGGVPPDINLNLWDEGDGIEETYKKHNASWHKQCRSLLHGTTLERLHTKHLRTIAATPAEKHLFEVSHDDYETPAKLAQTTRSSSGL